MRTESNDIAIPLPWLIIGVLAYLLWSQPAPGPGPGPTPPVPPPPTPPSPVERAQKVTKQFLLDELRNRADVFEASAAKVASGDIKTDRQLLEFVRSEINKGYDNVRKDFDQMCEDVLPENLAAEDRNVVAFLRSCSGVWADSAKRLR